MREAIFSFLRHLATAVGAGLALWGCEQHELITVFAGTVIGLLGASLGIADEYRAEKKRKEQTHETER